MKAGMIVRSKRRLNPSRADRRWFIKKEGTIKRTNGRSVTLIKGYRVAPLENLEFDFWVTEEQLYRRFEEVV